MLQIYYWGNHKSKYNSQSDFDFSVTWIVKDNNIKPIATFSHL